MTKFFHTDNVRSINVRRASLVSVAATILVTIFSAASSGAAAEGKAHAPAPAELSPDQLSPAIPGFGLNAVENQPLPTELSGEAATSPVTSQQAAETLGALVAAQTVSEEISPELKCLASAIYYEARSEPLSGQLAVGRVIVNRSRSGRFPNSYCGVVYQPSQFSFIHGVRGSMNQRLWHNAVAVAQIANDGSWQSEAEGALYFHAARVSPGWHLHKVAQIENHVFYR